MVRPPITQRGLGPYFFFFFWFPFLVFGEGIHGQALSPVCFKRHSHAKAPRYTRSDLHYNPAVLKELHFPIELACNE
jgi:hypothetical protein